MIEDQARSRADEEAAGWYARLSNASIRGEEVEAFFAWRKAPQNDAAYGRVEAMVGLARKLADDPALIAMANQAASRPKPLLARLRAKLRARLSSRKVRTRAWIAGGLLATAATVAGLLLAELSGQVYDTEVGERRILRLADGSSVELNTDSRIRVRLSKARREITLDRGQAMFQVAHDPARPFTVTADDTKVRAIGTRFEVYRAPTGVRVILAEGKVQVREAGADAAPVTLTAGQGLDVPRHPPSPGATPRPTRIDVAAATGWTQGRLTFNATPLAEAVAEANRYSPRKVALGASAPAGRKISGVFDAGDTEAFATGVATMLDLKRVRRADGAIELRAAGPGGGA